MDAVAGGVTSFPGVSDHFFEIFAMLLFIFVFKRSCPIGRMLKYSVLYVPEVTGLKIMDLASNEVDLEGGC